jgi:hypothetical protein
MQSWYSITLAEEEHRRAQILCMPPVAWKAEATRVIRSAHRGRTQEAIAFVQKMDAERARVSATVAPATPEARTADDADWALWQDMVEEPAKYGDDIAEWLAVDESLRAGPKRWRVAAYWLRKEQEEKDKAAALQAPFRQLYSLVAKEAATVAMKRWLDGDIKRFLARLRNAAVKIQAAVRGYLVRSSSPFLNCCMCLSHRICPLKTDHGMMCRGCAEQGPYEDATGPLADPWNWSRAEYVDMAPAYRCIDCDCVCDLAVDHVNWPSSSAYGFGTVCMACAGNGYETCAGCGAEHAEGLMDFAIGYGNFCSRACGPSGHAWERNF